MFSYSNPIFIIKRIVKGRSLAINGFNIKAPIIIDIKRLNAILIPQTHVLFS